MADVKILNVNGTGYDICDETARTGIDNVETSIAEAFSTTSTYSVGDYVTHNKVLYRCTTAVTTAGDWDSTKWTATNVMSEGTTGTWTYDSSTETLTWV